MNAACNNQLLYYGCKPEQSWNWGDGIHKHKPLNGWGRDEGIWLARPFVVVRHQATATIISLWLLPLRRWDGMSR